MMKNQETAIAQIEMEENIGCGIIITAVVLILGKLK